MMKRMKSQPLNFIDCQQELLRRAGSVTHQVARLKAQRLAWIIAAVAGWGVVGILIWMRASQ